MMRRISAHLLAAVLLLTAMLFAPAAVAESYRGIVKVGSMAVYSDAALTKKVGTLKLATVVTVESVNGTAAYINASGKRGYAKVTEMYSIDKIARPAAAARDTRVYQSPAPLSNTLTLKAGTTFNVLATNGDWVMVEKNSNIAYMYAQDVSYVQQPVLTPMPSATPVPAQSFTAQVTASKMSVYEKASTSSKCLGSLKKGATVGVVSYKDGWAYITLNGHYGYAKVSQMKKVENVPNPTTTAGPSISSDYLDSSKYSVEQKIYIYCTRELGMSRAAACAILANVQRECDFRVNCGSSDGGYGIVQWTGSRNTGLKRWCANNGYDYTTLRGQLKFLSYELNGSYKKIYNNMLAFDNTPQGAYDAAYYFCYYFEIPANRTGSSIIRGNLAKDKYWPRYAGW
jgi:Bacterial SH3 domain.